jgi:hypothetical protein
MRRLITIIGVLSIATSVMAASISYTDDWGSDGLGDKSTVGQGQGDWTALPGVSMFKADPTLPSGWTGNNLMMQAALGDKGIYNDLNADAGDPLATGEYFGPTVAEAVKLSSAYRQFSTWGGGSVNMSITLSGPDHSIGLRNPGGGGDNGTSYWEYNLDGAGWVATTMEVLTASQAGQWDGLWIEVSTSTLKVGIAAIGANHPNGDREVSIGTGSYSDWVFDTITIENDASACVRTGYLLRSPLPAKLFLSRVLWPCWVLVCRWPCVGDAGDAVNLLKSRLSGVTDA